jgi:hypothetical protein
MMIIERESDRTTLITVTSLTNKFQRFRELRGTLMLLSKSLMS